MSYERLVEAFFHLVKIKCLPLKVVHLNKIPWRLSAELKSHSSYAILNEFHRQ